MDFPLYYFRGQFVVWQPAVEKLLFDQFPEQQARTVSINCSSALRLSFAILKMRKSPPDMSKTPEIITTIRPLIFGKTFLDGEKYSKNCGPIFVD